MIGYRGQWRSNMVRLSITIGTALSSPGGQYVRIIHFFWKPNEEATSGPSNSPDVRFILQQGNQTSGGGGFPGSYLSPYNKEWARQYKVYSDKTYSLSTVGNTSVVLDKHYKKLRKNFDTNQPGGLGALYGWIPFVMFIYDTNVVADQPTISYYSRLSYTNF